MVSGFSPRGKELVGDEQARAAHYAWGRHLFGARERKNKIVETIAEPRKRHTLAGDSENSLRADGASGMTRILNRKFSLL